MTKELIIKDDQYKRWVAEICVRYQQSQIKAAVSVNREMLYFYWQLGRDITIMKAESKWGSGFYHTLSADLRAEIPDVKGFSVTNLRYMRRFFELTQFHPQLGGELKSKSFTPIHPQTGDEIRIIEEKQHFDSNDDILPLFSLPWGHIKLILDKCGTDINKAEFYIQETLKNNWSRAVLLNWMDTGLYERQGKAITNFKITLPKPQSDLAQEITKDPYNFDFIAIRSRYNEKELKDALMDNIQRFLMELGTGFAFIGREYRLEVGNTEQFLDLLFYNIKLHCYVVIEVKVSEFDPRDMGQLGTYVSAVDGLLRSEVEQPTIGLLICKTKDNVLAQYAANVIKAPIGISEYTLSKVLKDEFTGTLPTIEEIEQELRRVTPAGKESE